MSVAEIALAISALLIGLALFFFVGVRMFRRGQVQAEKSIRQVQVAQIPELAQECIEVFKENFGVELSYDDVEASTKALDAVCRSMDMKRAFAKDDFYWYFVQPTGAFLGELIRRNTTWQSQWRDGEAGPELVLKYAGSEMATHPFQKIVKNQLEQAGALHSYVIFAVRGPRQLTDD